MDFVINDSMKTPINCPFCGDVLRSEFPTTFENISMLEKKCDKKLNHKITFHTYTNNDDYISFIRIPLSGDTSVYWYFGSYTVEIITNGKLDLILPWFEPDLSNFTNLIDKVKTYLLFS